jgi:hypothetical protein
MNLTDYYNVLDLPSDSPVEDIKKAYRKKARIYHPDVNHSPDALDTFIRITEAYEFLLANHEKIKIDNQTFDQVMEDWRKYRQDRSRKRANAYARTSYVTFKNTRFYKSTRILDGTRIIFSFIISLLVIGYTIFGYIYQLRNPRPDLEEPSVFAFIMLLLLGLVFFVVSSMYLIVYHQTSIKRKRKKKSKQKA